jgi:hypothetical protein
MLEFIQWVILFLLGAAVGYLVRSQRHPDLPAWVRDIDPDELVTKAELDQYHHQVIQMSQAQRDLIQARFEELARVPAAEVHPEPIPVPAPPSVKAFVDPGISMVEELPAIAIPAIQEGALSDPASKAIALFLEGRTIDQIAQELRIGRQEAQLLIRMGRPQSRPLAGVS